MQQFKTYFKLDKHILRYTPGKKNFIPQPATRNHNIKLVLKLTDW